MPKLTVTIQRSNIYHIAEGISTTISLHNGGTPTFEQLWASPDEAKKLDIYYREAISDLERQLTVWIKETSAQFNLTQDGTDYTLALHMSRFWPTRLEGLLDNKLQDYLVHAVTAGWLNDFAGLEIKQDYQAMAGQDLQDIRSIICKREYDFHGDERQTNTDKGRNDIQAAERTAETEKDGPLFRPEVGLRRADNVQKTDNDNTPPYCRPKNLRHRDNDIVDTRSDYTDWSGTGIAYRDQRPACAPVPPPCPPPPPRKKDPRIPDNPTHPNYPPIHTDGIDWDDRCLYDEEGSENYINN